MPSLAWSRVGAERWILLPCVPGTSGGFSTGCRGHASAKAAWLGDARADTAASLTVAPAGGQGLRVPQGTPPGLCPAAQPLRAPPATACSLTALFPGSARFPPGKKEREGEPGTAWKLFAYFSTMARF